MSLDNQVRTHRTGSGVTDERLKRAQQVAESLRSKKNGSVRDLTDHVKKSEVTHYIDKKMAKVHSELRNHVRDDIDEMLGTARKTVVEIVQHDAVLGTVEGLSHFQLPILTRLATVRDNCGNYKNVLLKGPMGGGKSTACKQLADALGLTFGYIGQTNMPHVVVGSRDPIDKEFYRHTAFTEAFINGGVIVLEEMDAWNPNASLVLNPPLANGWLTLEDGSKHQRHKDCIIIACANTWGTGATAQYVGRNKLDDAFLDRFIKLDWQYDTALERSAANDNVVVDAVQKARYNANRYGLKINISPRSSIDIADMVRAGIEFRKAMDYNFLAGLDRDTISKVLEDVDF